MKVLCQTNRTHETPSRRRTGIVSFLSTGGIFVIALPWLTFNVLQPNQGVVCSDGTRYPLSRVEFIRDKSKVHPTQKPVALMEYLIRTYTNEGETVLDFTMGSGTTGVACVNTSRDFIGIELDADYYEIAKGRIAATPQA